VIQSGVVDDQDDGGLAAPEPRSGEGGPDPRGGDTGLAAPEPRSGEGGPIPHVRFAALLEVVACSGLPTQVAIHALVGLFGIHPFDATQHLSTAYVFTVSVLDAMALVALVSGFLALHGENWRDVLVGRRPLVQEGLLGVLQVPAIFVLAAVVMAAVHRFAPSLHDVATNPMEGLITSPGQAWLFVVVAVVGGGIREEVQRAFILHRFERHLGGAWLGLLLFSVVFGAGHVIQGRDVAVTTAALGLFWGVAYLRRRSIVSTVISHSGFNALEIVRFLFR
jgi:membrane protease YdiL (CAAX protease family)